MVAEREGKKDEDREEMRIGAVQLKVDEGPRVEYLGAMQGQVVREKSLDRELLYVDVCINGKQTRALVDTGATNNLISGVSNG